MLTSPRRSSLMGLILLYLVEGHGRYFCLDFINVLLCFNYIMKVFFHLYIVSGFCWRQYFLEENEVFWCAVLVSLHVPVSVPVGGGRLSLLRGPIHAKIT